ncbi:MAG: hypothetical protein ACOC53_08410, partial [Candidatus Saliniplasma sp.]
IAMLVITMVIAGYRDEGEMKIEEDPGELTLQHRTGEDQVGEPEAKAIGSTVVNNDSHLELETNVTKISPGGEFEHIIIHLTAEGTFEEDLEIDTFKFTASETEESEPPFNGIDFESSKSRIEGGEIWPTERQRTGVLTSSPEHYAYEGYDLESNDFTVDSILMWSIPEENVGEEFSLEIQSVVHGLSEDVTATVHVHLEG